MNKYDLSKLNSYLRNSKKEVVYLRFSELEELIKNKLPTKAYSSSRWWANDARFAKAQSWLSAGYEVFEAKYITSRKGVSFKRIKKSMFKSFRYSKLLNSIVTFVIIPLMITVIGAVIINEVNKAAEMRTLINSVENKYESHDFVGLIDDIDLLCQKLETTSNYDKICWATNIKANVQLDELKKTSLNNITVEPILSTCQSGLESAQKSNSTYYKMLFLYNNGILYAHLYEHTFEVKYADMAFESLNAADNIYVNMPPDPGFIPKLYDQPMTTDEMKILELELAIRNLLSDVHHTYINLVTLYEVTDNTSAEFLMLRDPEFRAYATSIGGASLMGHLFLLELEEQGIAITIEQQNIYSQTATNLVELSALTYLISQKYQLEDNESIDSVIEFCLNNIDTAIKYQFFDILETNYFSLARMYYIKYLYEKDKNNYDSFLTYFCLWFELTDDSLLIDDFDKYFTTIQTGELLSYYIRQVENHLSTVSFKETPSLYAYLKLDLGRHYLYLLEEQVTHFSRKDDIVGTYNNAINCINASLLYFTEDSNPAVYYSIEILIDKINSTYKEYERAK